MKKEYNTPKVEKVEFSYEENVVASGGHWEGNWEFTNTKCFCRWVVNDDKK